MGMRHRAVTVAAVAGVSALLPVIPVTPAYAHGALQTPPSRAALCGSEGGPAARSKACRAAAAVGDAPAEWDNLRLPGIDGKDREKIPNGKLCSAGIQRFAGLDLPRSDWPTTRLTSGARFSFRYRVTIPHQGTFRLYVTKNGFDPTRPLTWSDLEAKPFLTATDPPTKNGSYTLAGRSPKGTSGRHLIYTIWQNSSTPDTYYSCSDVVFGGAAATGGGKSGASGKPGTSGKTGASSTSGSPSAGPPHRAHGGEGPPGPKPPPAVNAKPVSKVSPTTDDGLDALLLTVVGGGAAVCAVSSGMIVALTRRSRIRREV